MRPTLDCCGALLTLVAFLAVGPAALGQHAPIDPPRAGEADAAARLAAEVDARIAAWDRFYVGSGAFATSVASPEELCAGLGPERFRAMKAHCDGLVAMGPKVLPVLAARMRAAPDGSVALVLHVPFRMILRAELTVVSRSVDMPEPDPGTVDRVKTFSWFAEWPAVVATGPNARNTLWSRWWREVAPHADAEVERLVGLWRQERDGRVVAAVHDPTGRVRRMGLVALPTLMRHVVAGEPDLIPLASAVTGGALPAGATVDEAKRWWAEHRAAWTVPVPSAD